MKLQQQELTYGKEVRLSLSDRNWCVLDWTHPPPKEFLKIQKVQQKKFAWLWWLLLQLVTMQPGIAVVLLNKEVSWRMCIQHCNTKLQYRNKSFLLILHVLTVELSANLAIQLRRQLNWNLCLSFSAYYKI